MKSIVHYMIILALVLGAIFLYNKQIGAIPLLLLSIYLFYIGFKIMMDIKKQ